MGLSVGEEKRSFQRDSGEGIALWRIACGCNSTCLACFCGY